MKQQVKIGEQQVSPELLAKVAPDIVDQKGQQQLATKHIAAQRIQGVLDKALQMASDKLGGFKSTRIKDIDTAMKKVAQKRIEGRTDYDMSDLRDFLGGRLVVEKNKISNAKNEIEAMEKAGLFSIKKEELRKVGTYDAYHYDVKLPDGTFAEIQLHTKRSEAVSVANHDIRAHMGENPPDQWKQVQKKQAALIDIMPGDKAKIITEALQNLHKMNNNKSIPAELTAAIIKGVTG